MDELKYPIGRLVIDDDVDAEKRTAWISEIEATPAALAGSVAGLSESQQAASYRPGGWTVRQVVHHMADSHLQGCTRFKLALTEDAPLIKPYLQAKWAELPDVRLTPIDVSLTLLHALHTRWVGLLKTMQPQDFERTVQHPERGDLTLDRLLQVYAWHGKHHVAHITQLRDREGWW